MLDRPTVLVTGGAGYVGAVLVPKLLDKGYEVTVLDLFLYGRDCFRAIEDHPNLSLIEGDIRDQGLLAAILPGIDTVIHLACISNDPSFELDPELGKSINYDAFEPLVDQSKANGVQRFIYASSSSVYGIKDCPNVTEELPLEPLTDYSRYKALCEDILLAKRAPGFEVLVIRPATVCGYSPRQRLDVVVNILTAQALAKRHMTIFGGEQLRPNIHIQDMAQLYVEAIEWPADKVDGKIFNAGYENLSVREIAQTIASAIGGDVTTEVTTTDDIRSYHVSAEKLRQELGFSPKHSVADAVDELVAAECAGLLPDMLTDPRYYNIRTMQACALS
ncbi:MAG: NAD(P)-dependent oxidoreductase [Chlamydiia bacterium]|nr:NAD(P)-dependent oxidoreductase [Chlamydiia bacterium]